MTDKRPKRCRCGSGVTTLIHRGGGQGPRFYVLCGACPASTSLHRTKQGAMKAWNAGMLGDPLSPAFGGASGPSPFRHLLRRRAG